MFHLIGAYSVYLLSASFPTKSLLVQWRAQPMRQSRIVLLLLQKSGIQQLVEVGSWWISETNSSSYIAGWRFKPFFPIGDTFIYTWVDVPSNGACSIQWWLFHPLKWSMWMNKMMKWELRDRFVHRSLGLGFFPNDSAAHQRSKSGRLRPSTNESYTLRDTKHISPKSGAFWVGLDVLPWILPTKKGRKNVSETLP